MSDTVLTCLIGAAVTVITVLISGRQTRERISQEMHEEIAVMQRDMEHMSRRIDEHNGYAKLFSENIPAIREHIKYVDERLEKLESK